MARHRDIKDEGIEPIAGGTNATPADPEMTLRTLSIEEIQSYERNPRRRRNPQYERIKQSIRVHGIDQPLIVTRRPGDETYVVHAGGNTRLAILRELYQETGDPRFFQVTCLCRAWTQETDVLLAHLRENDLHGALTFYDKARAIIDAWQLLEQEGSTEELTQAALADRLRERGYPVSQSLICQIRYAIDRLVPLIPVALEAGLGRPQVERIRTLERTVSRYWNEHAVDSEAEFDIAFATLCRRLDTADWSTDDLRRALEAEIADRTGIPVQAVRLALKAGDARHPPDTIDLDVEPSEDALTEVDDPPLGAASEPPTSDAGFSLVKAPTDPPRDLKSLRARAWLLATRLAQRQGLPGLVQPLSGQGLGFVLSDVPDPALADQLDDASLAQVSQIWWLLAAAAEMTVAPVSTILPLLASDSILYRALEQQDTSLLHASAGTPDLGHAGFQLWWRLEERGWRDLIDLMTTYRAIHQLAETTGAPLWP